MQGFQSQCVPLAGVRCTSSHLGPRGGSRACGDTAGGGLRTSHHGQAPLPKPDARSRLKRCLERSAKIRGGDGLAGCTQEHAGEEATLQ